MYVYCITKLSIKTFIHMLWLQLALEWYTGWHLDVFQPYEGCLFAWYIIPYMAERHLSANQYTIQVLTVTTEYE